MPIDCRVKRDANKRRRQIDRERERGIEGGLRQGRGLSPRVITIYTVKVYVQALGNLRQVDRSPSIIPIDLNMIAVSQRNSFRRELNPITVG